MEESQAGSGPSKPLNQVMDEAKGSEDQGPSPRAQGAEDIFSGPSLLEKGHCSLLHDCAPTTKDSFTVTFPGKYRDRGGQHSDVAVKLPKTDSSLKELSLKAIRNELEVFSQLEEEDPSDNVVHCFGGSIGDADEWDLEGLDHIQVEGQKDCIVLEPRVKNLHALLYQDTEFSRACTYRKLISIFINVARGLEHVHQSSVVHCDLNLSNIDIDQEGRAKLAGFHTSTIRSGKYIPWQLIGTLGYIAPELFWSRHNAHDLKINERVDTFAFGVMMLECLTREHAQDVQQKNYPDLWQAIHECCGDCMCENGEGGTSIATIDTGVRESLNEKLYAHSVAKFLPWPDAFWRLLDQEDSVEGKEISLHGANEVVKNLRQVIKNQSRSAIDPWPPELCLLIAECVSFLLEEGKCSVKRPSACEIAGRLEAMCDDACPWLDNALPWASVASERVALSQRLDAGSCRLDYPENNLGEGAYGSVFKGLYKDEEGMPHDVAVKLVTKYKETIQKELKVFETVSGGHPNVVQCFGGSSGDGVWDMERMKHIKIAGKEDFLVLEYLPRNLHQLLHEDKGFETSCTYERLIKLFIDIAQGLQFLHGHWIVHFDLKPSNVLMDNWGRAKVTDFGESKIRVKDSITQSRHGTMGYIAPELMAEITGKDVRVSDNVDIYSLGSMMLECLTRKAPVEFAHYLGGKSTSASEETMSDLEGEAPEFWALVRDCCNCHEKDEKNFVVRPTPAAVVHRLVAMLDLPWAGKSVSWVCGS